MKKRSAVTLIAALTMSGTLTGIAVAEDFKLPPEVTPALRAACEADVRRVCVGKNPTYSKVRRCVIANFSRFGKRCKIQIALAGFKR